MRILAILLLGAVSLGQTSRPANIVTTNPAKTNVFVGPTSVLSLNSIQFADQYSSVQAAISALPTGGGTVYIPCGTYPGPTTITSGVRLVSLCGALPATQINSLGLPNSPANLTILQYPSGLTISAAQNISIENIVLDMQNNVTANVTMSNVTFSDFKVAVVNCGTNPCLTLLAPNSTNASTSYNRFPLLILQNGTIGLQLTGTGSGPNAYVTDNHFGHLIINFPSSQGILFDKWCDSNTFERVDFNYSGNVGMVTFNSSTSVNQGVKFEAIKWINATGSGITTAKAITFNPSLSNFIRTGVLGGYSGNLTTFNNAATIPTTYEWDDTGGNAIANTTTYTLPDLWLDATANPGIYLSLARTIEWQQYVGASNEIEFKDATANREALLQGGGHIFDETTAPSGSASATTTYADSALHQLKANYNNTGFFPVPLTANAGGTHSDSGFMQSKRAVTGCATAASLNATCDTTVTWNTAFADANYTVSCVGEAVTSGVPAIEGVAVNTAKTASAITVRTISITAAAAQFSTIECVAIHD